MKNEYEVRGDVTAIIINSPKYGKQEALISTSKLDRVKEFPNGWYVTRSSDTQALYVFGQEMTNKKSKKTHLHRWVTDAVKGMVVDHIDHNTLNNTDSNLRVVTSVDNSQNRKGANSTSKSGIRGVSWSKEKNKWRSTFTFNKVVVHVGYFEDITEAEHAVTDMRMKYANHSKELPL